jgi:hypothetical protein
MNMRKDTRRLLIGKLDFNNAAYEYHTLSNKRASTNQQFVADTV